MSFDRDERRCAREKNKEKEESWLLSSQIRFNMSNHFPRRT